jgi:hypothetical protein
MLQRRRIRRTNGDIPQKKKKKKKLMRTSAQPFFSKTLSTSFRANAIRRRRPVA